MRWLIFICVMFGVGGCQEKASPTVVLKIPDGFTGVIILRWQQPQGIELKPSEKSYTLEIPATGVLAIRGKNLMLDWYAQEARYLSGRILPQGNQHTKDEDGIYLWDMGVNADASECWYVVGKSKDREGVWEKKVGMPRLNKN